MRYWIVKIAAIMSLVGALIVPTAATALAADPHSAGTTGQPNQSCQATNPPNFPGNTGSAPGSAFNGTAGTVYAGNGNTGNTKAQGNNPVAQYDVACFQHSQP